MTGTERSPLENFSISSRSALSFWTLWYRTSNPSLAYASRAADV